MTTPDVGKLSLSDSSDAEDLFASPSRTSKSTKKANPTSTEALNAPLQRNGASKYDTEQARNTALQKELEGVRGINEVIEGVISSLECAKGNMDVRIYLYSSPRAVPNNHTDGLAHSHFGIHSPKYMGSHPLTDRA